MIKYGLFLSNILNFIIMAFVVFLIVKWINKLKRPDTPAFLQQRSVLIAIRTFILMQQNAPIVPLISNSNKFNIITEAERILI